MNRGQARMVAIVVVVAMIVAVAAAALTGGDGDDAADAAASEQRVDRGAGALGPTDEAAGVQGPHLRVLVCNGVSCPAPSAAEVQALGDRLRADPRTGDVEFESAELAYQRFLDVYADDEEFAATVSQDDIPASYYVDVLVADALPDVMADVGAMAGVEDVIDLQQLGAGA